MSIVTPAAAQLDGRPPPPLLRRWRHVAGNPWTLTCRPRLLRWCVPSLRTRGRRVLCEQVVPLWRRTMGKERWGRDGSSWVRCDESPGHRCFRSGCSRKGTVTEASAVISCIRNIRERHGNKRYLFRKIRRGLLRSTLFANKIALYGDQS